jgi:hypothetical protein
MRHLMPTNLIEGDKTIPPVAVRQHQARRSEHRFGRAVLRTMQAIENRVADVFEVGTEPPRLLELVAVGGARLGIRGAVVRDDL